MTTTNWTSDATGTGEYASVNGIDLYYETHGSGRPLVLLHGGLGSGEMFGPVLPSFTDHRQVILVDLQGHGRTADIDRPIDVRLMADDVAALIEHLGLDDVDLVGYSLGGGVALQTAIRHPERVRRLVAASANVRRDATYADILAQQGQVSAAAAEFMKETPLTVGSPQQVIDRTLGFRAYVGDYQRQLFLVDHAGLPQSVVLEQMDMLGEDVLPVLRKEFEALRAANVPPAPTHAALKQKASLEQKAGSAGA